MEDKEHWLVGLCAFLLLDISLVLVEQLGVELNVTWLVDTVNVSKASSDREVWADLRQSGPDLVNVLWLSIEGVVVYIFVVNTIFLTTSDADFLRSVSRFSVYSHRSYHLEPLLHGCCPLEILRSGLNVPVHLFLGQIDHVRRI